MGKNIIRKNLTTNIIGDKTPPFSSFFQSDKVLIQFNGQDPISIFNKSKFFYDSFQIQMASQTIVSVAVPTTDTIFISDQHGNKWTLEFKYDKGQISDLLKDFIEYYKTLLNGISSSIFFHLALVLFFTAIYYISQESTSIREFIGLKSKGVEAIQANLSMRTPKEAPPFSGVSLKEYLLAHSDKNTSPRDKVTAATNSIGKISGILSKSSLQGISGKMASLSQNTALPKLDTQTLIAESLKDTRNKEIQNSKKLNSPTVATATPAISTQQYDKKEMHIRSILQSIKVKLSHDFDESLRLDPNLSVIVIYDALIDSNGRLTQIRLSTKGSGAALAIETLKKKVSQTFESLQFSKEYAGTPIHGEQVFIK